MPELRRMVVLVVAGFSLAVPTGAGAGTVSADPEPQAAFDPDLTFTAAEGEVNTVTVSKPASRTFVVSDSTAPITAGANCTQKTATEVECKGLEADGESYPIRLAASLGDGNDRYTSSLKTGTEEVDAGTGDDEVHTGNGQDTIHGGGGLDKLYAGKGDFDEIFDDDAPGEAGQDIRDGGPGFDRLDLQSAFGPLRIDLKRPDPSGDRVVGFEQIWTPPTADVLKGSDRDEQFGRDNNGKDVLVGRGGDDELETGMGGKLNGGRGDDSLTVESTDEMLETKIDCGPGTDDVEAWRTDLLDIDCERADAGAVNIGVHRLRTISARRYRERHVLRFTRVFCTQADEAVGCSGRVRLLRKDGTLVSLGRFSINKDYGWLDFKLRRADRKRLARGHVFTFAGVKPGRPGFRMRLKYPL